MNVVEEKLELNRNISGISETDISIASGEGVQDIWVYQVPVGHKLIFKREDVFAAYLEDSQGTPAEASAASSVDVVIKDASKQVIKPLLNQVRYTQCKEFQDVDKLLHVDIPVGEVFVAEEGEFVVVRGNILTQTLDASDSYFLLTCHRIRKSLFGDEK